MPDDSRNDVSRLREQVRFVRLLQNERIKLRFLRITERAIRILRIIHRQLLTYLQSEPKQTHNNSN